MLASTPDPKNPTLPVADNPNSIPWVNEIAYDLELAVDTPKATEYSTDPY